MSRLGVFVAALVLTLSQVAHAGVLSSLLTFDGPKHNTTIGGLPFIGGGEDALNDESRSFLDERSGTIDGIASVGDVLYGMITISDIDSSGVPDKNIGETRQLAIVFSLKVTAISGAVVTFGAIGTSADAADLRNLLDGTISAPAGLNDKSVFVVVGNELGTDEGATDPLDFNKATAALEILEFKAANGWKWELTGGLVSATDFSQLQLGVPDGSIGTQSGGFTVQKHDFGGSIVFLPVDVRHSGINTTHDVVLSKATVDPTGDSPWTFEDAGQFVINPVPEPSSIVVWSAILVVGFSGIFLVRRR